MRLFFKPVEIAEVLALNPETIRKHIRCGNIKAVRVGNSWRIPRVEAIRAVGTEDVLRRFDDDESR